MNQNVICIAGAHRSGTSMLTRLLHCCGLDLGAEKDLMPAAEDNPDGFWENLRFVQINDEVLNTTGSAWDLPPLANEHFNHERLEASRAKARLLIEEFAAKPSWGWKDPRNCLTLPFWKALLPGIKTILVVRNPLEVAYSMHERNGSSYALALRLWDIYNRRLLTSTKPYHRIVTHYQTFFTKPQAELQRITMFTGLPGDQVDFAAETIKVTRRHTSFTLEQLLDAGVPEAIVSLYKSLLDEAAGAGIATSSGSNAKRPALAKDPLIELPRSLNLGAHEAENVRRELAQRRGDELQYQARIEQQIREIGRREGRIEELQANSARLAAENERLSEELQTTTARLVAENVQQSSALEEMENTRDRFLQTNSLLQANSIRLSEAESRVASLTQRLRTQLQQSKRLARLFDSVEEAADRLRHSRRWLVANPFTALAAKLLGRPFPGFGHLDNVIEKYRAWRARHPEIDEIDNAIQTLRAPAQPAHHARVSLTSPAKSENLKPKPPPPTIPIAFPLHKDVEVSIVIPVFNQLEFTEACLASIQQHTDAIAFEVIVVDDCSTDSTRDAISKLSGVTYLKNDVNSGFTASCNRGAETARGSYLMFLNNDTTVTAGWLRSLIDTFELDPSAGLVGSKLIYPDGKLQEAGGIIWRDGSGWNRGKFQDPQLPEYNYLREADYCSAASVLIPRILFDELGGFDEKYSPAYYEDVDLAFKVRRAGRKVLYQPLSEVIHYEGATGGTDISTGAKQYQEVNRATFVRTWAASLAARPENGDIKTLETLRENRQAILIIDHHLPMTDRDAGSLRMFHILQILRSLGHRVTFLPDNLADIAPYGSALQKRGIKVIYYPYAKTVREYLKEDGGNFDTVILSRCDFARKHMAAVREFAPQSRIIFDTVDLHHLRMQREAQVTKDLDIGTKAGIKEQQEYELIEMADETWVASVFEQELLQRKCPYKSIEVVPTIAEIVGSATSFGSRRDFLFIGSFQHQPNVDAVVYFAREIYPLIHRKIPEALFFIIGDKAPPEVVALANETVIVTGLQSDIRPFFDNVKLSVAPLRFGAGVKGKINQSMSFGVPVVATSLAVEGMGLEDREHILVADDPEDFATAVVELYRSEKLWNRISELGLRKARELFSPESIKPHLAQLLNKAREGCHESQPRVENPR